eukprot:31407-Pelagococcus_subviridis.AAC.5
MPLHKAASNGHEAVVRALIEAGADVNKANDNGTTPLFIAAQKGHEAVVKALMEAGAVVNKADNHGGTPLHGTARNGHEAVVKALVDAGADVNKVFPGAISSMDGVHMCWEMWPSSERYTQAKKVPNNIAFNVHSCTLWRSSMPRP